MNATRAGNDAKIVDLPRGRPDPDGRPPGIRPLTSRTTDDPVGRCNGDNAPPLVRHPKGHAIMMLVEVAMAEVKAIA